jgi:hypothetical protein
VACSSHRPHCLIQIQNLSPNPSLSLNQNPSGSLLNQIPNYPLIAVAAAAADLILVPYSALEGPRAVAVL